ncbi:MAG: arylesterase [Nitrospirota bacterium]
MANARVRADGVTSRERIALGVAWGWLFCAAVGSVDARDQPVAVPTIVAFGDSLTAGFGVPSEDAYPSRLERRLREEGYAYRVVNAGVSGETTAGGLRRVDWVLKSRPSLVILELGANDGLRGLSPEQTRENLARIIEGLRDAGVTVILAGMRVPPNYGDEYARAFEAVFPALATRYQLPLIPFFLDGVATDPALNQADGLHPTSDGYRVIVERIWPRIRPLLTRP